MHHGGPKKQSGVKAPQSKSNQNGPAGPSSLAAYQTCRASTSFGRIIQWRFDTGRRPGLCTLAHSAERRSGLRSWPCASGQKRSS